MKRFIDMLTVASWIVVFFTTALIAVLFWGVRSVLEREPEDEYDR